MIQPTVDQLQVKHHGVSSSNNNSDDDDDEHTISPDGDVSPAAEVGHLARYLSAQSNHGNLFDYESGSSLDPFSDKFDAKLWVKKFASLEDWGADRASGVSFKDMSVFGYGTDSGKVSSLRLAPGWNLD